MNCRQGDLAIVVRSALGNEGKIVRCVRLHSSETHDLDGVALWSSGRLGPRWVIDPPLPSKHYRRDGSVIDALAYTCADANLRPIRGTDAQDETAESRELEAA